MYDFTSAYEKENFAFLLPHESKAYTFMYIET